MSYAEAVTHFLFDTQIARCIRIDVRGSHVREEVRVCCTAEKHQTVPLITTVLEIYVNKAVYLAANQNTLSEVMTNSHVHVYYPHSHAQILKELFRRMIINLICGMTTYHFSNDIIVLLCYWLKLYHVIKMCGNKHLSPLPHLAFDCFMKLVS